MLDLHFNGPQSRAWESLAPRQTVTLAWGRGVGKSWFLRTAAWLLLAQHAGKVRRYTGGEQRGIRIVWLLPTLKQFRDVHGQQLLDEVQGQWAFLRPKLDRTTLRVSLPDGSWMQPFPAEAHSSKTARGLRCDVVLADECDDVDPSVFESVVRPWFSEPWSLKIRLLCGTPRRGRHGLLWRTFQLGRSGEPGRYHSVHATYLDAPETVDPDEAEDARRNSPPATFRREWLCDFDAAEGLVFGDVFSESLHVKPTPDIRFPRHVVGVDWGYADPGVMLVCGVSDGSLWVTEEHYATQQVLDYWVEKARDIHARHPGAIFWCDSSRPDAIKQLRSQAGVDARPATHKIADGLARVANLMAPRESDDGQRWSQFSVDPSCRNLLRELGLYRRKRDPMDPDRYLEEIQEGNDHTIDALRYAVVGALGHVPAERVEWTATDSW